MLQTLAEHGVLDRGLKVRSMVLPDLFIDQDSPVAMYAKAGLDANGIVAKVFEALGKDRPMAGAILRHLPELNAAATSVVQHQCAEVSAIRFRRLGSACQR